MSDLSKAELEELEAEDKVVHIPLKYRDEASEERVTYYLATYKDVLTNIGMRPFEINKTKYKRVVIPKFADDRKKRIWEEEEIKRCKKGYKGMSGKMYFYFNYLWMVNLTKGKFTPDYQVCQNEWFKKLTAIKDEGGWGMVCVKRRRIGASWIEACDAIHDAIFYPFSITGMVSKSKEDSRLLFVKVNFIFDNLPDFLKVKVGGKTKDQIDFYKKEQDSLGNDKITGNQSYIVVKAPTVSTFEGHMLNKLIIDEAGKQIELEQMFSFTEDVMMEDTVRVGIPVIFGCVCAGTKVWDTYGNFVNIENLRKKDGIIGYDGEGLYRDNIVNINKPIEKECVRIKTNTGRELECSIDHPILRRHKLKYWYKGSSGKDKHPHSHRTEFVNAGDLGVGDKVAIIESVGVFGTKRLWQPRLLGLLVGDGTYTFDNTPLISNADIEINDYIENNFETSLSIERPTMDGRIYKETRIKGICPNLREIGIYGQSKLKKTLPLNIQSYTKEDICEFLGGFFDADGYVANMKGNKNISLSSMSESLLRETSFLLQKLGIHGGIYRIKKSEKNPIDKNDHFRLTISDKRSVLAFHKQIKFITKRKQDNLEIIVKRFSDGHGEKISKFAKGYRLEKIKSIESIGLQKVYNLGTKTTETYIANGIITHNTSGEIGKAGKGLKTMWDNSDVYRLHKFFFAGYMGIGVDEYGNDNIEDNIRWIVYERKRRAQLSSKAYSDFLQRYPLTISEAFNQSSEGGLGDIVKIKAQQDALEIDPPKATKGTFGINKDRDIVFKPSVTGEVVIYEHAKKGMKDLYVAGSDPADHDKDDRTNLSDLSLYIMKKAYGTQPPTIVAQYTARPKKLADYYQQAIMMLQYYNNCKVLIEKNRARMIAFFDENGFKYLLHHAPQGIVKLTGGTSFSIGITMTQAMKEYLADLCVEYIDDHCKWIPDIDLLKEFPKFGAENTDRIIGFGLALMLLKEDKTISRKGGTVDVRIPTTRMVRGKGGNLVRQRRQ